MSRRSIAILVLIVLVAIATRAVFAGYIVGWNTPGKGDDLEFHVLARNIADGVGFVGLNKAPTARRAPLYPWFVSNLYRVTGPSQAISRVAQVLLGAAIAWLTFLVGRRHFGEAAGLVAGGLVALNPFLAFVSGYMLSENLFLVLVLLALWRVPRPADAGLNRQTLIFAVLLGLAALTRPTAAMLTVWIAASVALFGSGHWRRRIVTGLLIWIVAFVVALPWMVRNAKLLDGWVGITSFGGVVFYQSNNPHVVDVHHYRGGVAPLAALPRWHDLAVLGEREQDELATKMGTQFLRARWREVPGLIGWKLVRFWRLNSDMGMSGIRSGWWFDTNSLLGKFASHVDVGFMYAVVALPLFGFGLYRTRSRWRELMFLYGVVVVHTALAMVFFGSIRMRVPVEPVIAIFAGAMAVEISRALWGRFRRRRLPVQDPAAA